MSERNEQQSVGQPGNPYQSPAGDRSAPDTMPSVYLAIAAWLMILVCIVSLGFWTFAFLISVWLPPHSISISLAVYTGMFMIFPVLALVGAISALQKKRYWLAMLGASALLVPVFGAVFGLAFPVGIWAIILLRHTTIRKSFAP